MQHCMQVLCVVYTMMWVSALVAMGMVMTMAGAVHCASLNQHVGRILQDAGGGPLGGGRNTDCQPLEVRLN
jgi:hypothetical protein